MKAVDRVMKAYSEKHQLSDEQAVLVRDELSAFIHELLVQKAEIPLEDRPLQESK